MWHNYHSLVIESGGYENVAFIKREDIYHVQKERRLWLGDGDVIIIQDYFMKMQVEDNMFLFIMLVDAENQLKNVFSIGAMSWKAYKELGAWSFYFFVMLISFTQGH